jgi:hypothetical protein
MTPTTPFSLPSALAAAVAEATAVLPPLTKDTDDIFLRMVFEESIDGFWRMYIDWLPQSVKDEFLAAMESDAPDAMEHWQRTHANFAEVTTHRAKAQMIVQSISEKLFASIVEAYSNWSPDEAAATVGTWEMQAEAFFEDSPASSDTVSSQS